MQNDSKCYCFSNFYNCIYYYIFQLIKKNNTNYIYSLISEFIGILIDFIVVFTGNRLGIELSIIICIFTIIIPVILISLESKNINISEIIFLMKINMKDDDIKKILLDAIKKYPNSHILHKKLAAYYEKNKEYEKAEDEYIEAIRIQANDYATYYKLSVILYKDNKKEEASELLESLLKYKPDNYQASILLGKIFYENNQFKESANVYDRALRYFPNKYELYYNLGITYTRLNDFKKAKEYYHKAANINPDDGIAYLNLGQIYLIYRECNEAEKCFYNALKGSNNISIANAYFYLAKIKIENDEKDLAIQYCNIAIETYPNIIKKIEKDDELTQILGKNKFQKFKPRN